MAGPRRTPNVITGNATNILDALWALNHLGVNDLPHRPIKDPAGNNTKKPSDTRKACRMISFSTLLYCVLVPWVIVEGLLATGAAVSTLRSLVKSKVKYPTSE